MSCSLVVSHGSTAGRQEGEGQLDSSSSFYTPLVIRLPHAHLYQWRGYVVWKQTLYRVLTGPLAFLKTVSVILAPLVRPHC